MEGYRTSKWYFFSIFTRTSAYPAYRALHGILTTYSRVGRGNLVLWNSFNYYIFLRPSNKIKRGDEFCHSRGIVSNSERYCGNGVCWSSTYHSLFIYSYNRFKSLHTQNYYKILFYFQVDPDQIQITRTIEQEHNALSQAFKAVDIMTELVPHLKSG